MPDFAAAVRKLRPISESAMYESIEVIRETEGAVDDMGYPTSTVGVVATYPGRYRTSGATELQMAAQMQASIDGVITVPYSADIRETDTLRRGTEDYRVSGVMKNTEELSAHLEVMVRKA